MAQQTIPDGLWVVIKSALASNFTELYENKQAPVTEDGTFTFLYGANTTVAETGNIRFSITGESKINVERYDGSRTAGEEWVLVAVIGSIETNYVELIGSNPRVFTANDSDGIYNFLRLTQSVSEGIDIGDTEAKVYISSSETPVFVIANGSEVQTEYEYDSEVYTGESVCIVTEHNTYGKDTALNFKFSNPVGKMRILVYRDEEMTQLAYKSHKDWNWNENGEGYDVVSGLNSIDLGNNPITFGAGTISCVVLESKSDISILGSTTTINEVTKFRPYMQRVVVTADAKVAATTDYVDSKISNVGIAAGYFTETIETSCYNADTWYKVNAQITPTYEHNFEFDSSTARWVYKNGSGFVSIMATWTGSHDDGNSRYISWEFRKNGLQLEYPPKVARIESSDPMSMSLLVPYMELVTDDYVELWVKVDSPYDKARTANFNILIR